MDTPTDTSRDADRRVVVMLAEKITNFVETHGGVVTTVVDDPDQVIMGVNFPVEMDGGVRVDTKVSLLVNVTP